ncbi:MAG: porin [Pseudomonadota bacterium]
MNIKSLLLGSAAAMVAVSGAQAADAIVVEPEPVEYVRVCDAYGSGFFYIPGTETCIRFSGFIRSAYDKTYFDGEADALAAGELGTVTNTGPGPDGFNGTADDVTQTVPSAAVGASTFDGSSVFWGQRARLNIDTRNETDWGTLRAIYRLEGDGNTDSDIDMDVALISLAGFRAGFAGGNYWSSNHGFGWVNAEGIGSSFGGISVTDGFYGFDDATIFDYTWAADGFSVTIGVEDPRIKNGTGDPANGTFSGGTGGDANFYAGFNYSGEGFGVAFTAVHDSLATEVTAAGVNANRGEWAYKVSANVDLSGMVPGGTLWGTYMDDGDAITNYVHANAALANPNSIWAVAFQMNLTDEVEFWANYWDADSDFAVVGSGVGTEGNATQFGIGLNWYPAAAPGFHIKAAYFNGEIENSRSGTLAGAVGATTGQSIDADYDGFEVVLRRDF